MNIIQDYMLKVGKKILFINSMSALFFLNVPILDIDRIILTSFFIIVAGSYIYRKSICDFKMLNSINESSFIMAIIICGILAWNAYTNWPGSNVIVSFSDKLGVDNLKIAFVLAVIGFISALPFTTFFLTKVFFEIKTIFQKLEFQNDNLFKFSWEHSIIFLFSIYVVACIALFRTNINYKDDMERIVEGCRGWNNFSRFVSNDLASLIFANSALSDASPLLQIIAMGEMAFGTVILLMVFFERTRFSLAELLTASPIALNPYFMECISYKFDSPFMAMSVLISILPFIFKESKTIMFVTISAIGTVIMCTTYQASAGIYPMIAILLTFKMWINKDSTKEILKFIISGIAGFAIGLAFFLLAIMIPVNAYVSNHLPVLTQLIPTFLSNLIHYYSLVNSDFAKIWKLMFLLIIIIFICKMVYESEQNKILSCGAILLALGSLGLIAFGLYPALQKPLFETRAMYGFGVLIALLSVNVAEGVKITFYKIPSLVLSWMFFIFSFIYGNAMDVQKNYTQFRIIQTITDLQDIEYLADDESTVVQIRGTIGKSSVLSTSLERYPVLDRLIPVTFRDNWGWGTYEFYNYYGLKNVTSDDSVELSALNLPLLKDTNYNTIYGDSQNILVILK